MTDIAKAIKAINPTAEFSVNAEDYEQITWLNSTPVISRENIETKLNELQAEYDALEYQRKRDAEYPSIKDQLDKIYHEGIDKWKEDMIKPVKDKHPKDQDMALTVVKLTAGVTGTLPAANGGTADTLGGGKVLQVAIGTDTAAVDNTTTDYANGVGVELAFTPVNASSTLYIICTGSFGTSSGAYGSNQNLNVQIYDSTNTTQVAQETESTNIFLATDDTSVYMQTQGSFSASVAASDTVARTYQLRFAMNVISNSRESHSSNSQMTIYEVAA